MNLEEHLATGEPDILLNIGKLVLDLSGTQHHKCKGFSNRQISVSALSIDTEHHILKVFMM